MLGYPLRLDHALLASSAAFSGNIFVNIMFQKWLIKAFSCEAQCHILPILRLKTRTSRCGDGGFVLQV